jgi:hypothetical protein
MKTVHACAALAFAVAASPAIAQNVKITPLGSHAGDLCASDRAMVTVASAAYAMNELVKPASVILSHVNEAATEDGKLRPSSRTAALMKQLKGVTPYLSVSGRTMEFDGKGKCAAGC